MTMLIGLLIAAVCLCVVCRPFFKKRDANVEATTARINAAMDVQDAASQELKTIEAEYAVGELSEAEYQTRRNQLRIAAARALRDQDRLRGDIATGDATIEAEVLAARRARRQPRCEVCGSARPSNATECTRCGTKFASS